MQFNQESGLRTPTDLIPNGFLCWVLIKFQGMKASGTTGGSYANLEFRVDDNQPFARKPFWDMVCDPDDERNSEGWRQSGMAALTRMLESSGFVDPANPESYTRCNGYTCEQILMALDGKRVAVRVKVEDGEDGYQDKNKIGDFLTPNPKSSGYKGFTKLSVGDHNLGQAKPAVAASWAFGQPAGQQVTAGGSQQPLPLGQQPLKPASGLAPLGAMAPANAGMTARSPSSGGGFNPNAAPNWLDKQQPR